MQDTRSNSETWQAPDWHPDWGEVDAEFELLRRFAMTFLRELPDCPLWLRILEPGYMHLELVPCELIRMEAYVPGRATAGSDKISLQLFCSGKVTDIESTNIANAVALAVQFARTASDSTQ